MQVVQLHAKLMSRLNINLISARGHQLHRMRTMTTTSLLAPQQCRRRRRRRRRPLSPLTCRRRSNTSSVATAGPFTATTTTTTTTTTTGYIGLHTLSTVSAALTCALVGLHVSLMAGEPSARPPSSNRQQPVLQLASAQVLARWWWCRLKLCAQVKRDRI